MLPHHQEERAFDVIPFEDIQGEWKKLGSGSFGNVWKGTYLGIEVAIKEVLPSDDYDVAKYFEREWRLMKEARHPNVVLYLGLSRRPAPDNRIYIVSEYIEGGNLRMYIHDKSKPLPWRHRLSFATDIARALAYLHARKCIHRDLKGENLLVTANGRLKITDFGFARIAARNAEESRRLTFCGTDAYMSPEIQRGDEFDVKTDVYSLGVILCEIGARKLADDSVFKRAPPRFLMDEAEIKKRVGAGSPKGYVDLALQCLKENAAERPNMLVVLQKLREMELEVLQEAEGEAHVGSIKFLTGKKVPGVPRIPSFGMGIGKDIRTNGASHDSSDSESDEDAQEVVEAVKKLDLAEGWSGLTDQQPLLDDPNYSTTVVKHSPQGTATPSLSSILTIRSPVPGDSGQGSAVTEDRVTNIDLPSGNASTLGMAGDQAGVTQSGLSFASFETYHTAHSSVSTTGATEGGSTIRTSASAFSHRFTLIKPGGKRGSGGAAGPVNGGAGNYGPGSGNNIEELQIPGQAGWAPFGFFFSSGLGAKCDMCNKRLGKKAVLECDDCGLRAHIACGETAPMDCGLRPVRPRVPNPMGQLVPSPPPGSPHGKGNGASSPSPPLSKAVSNAIGSSPAPSSPQTRAKALAGVAGGVVKGAVAKMSPKK